MFVFRGYSASSSAPEKHDRIALWYTGVTCSEHRMFTHYFVRYIVNEIND